MKKKYLFLIVFILAIPFLTVAQLGKKTISVTVDPKDANIYANGELLGQGAVEVVVRKNDCVKLEVGKTGWLWQSAKFCHQKGYAKPPKSKYFELQKDDAFEASISGTDISNIDIPVRVKDGLNEKDAWRQVAQIITSYFDVIEVTDRETGYLRTAWHLNSFSQSSIRTRLLLKTASNDPLTFTVKIVSERANGKGVSAKADEKYQEWSRVLRKFSGIVDEVLSRMQ
ncbi:hypothetical protein ACRTDU_10075 [Sunxiuqinia elliptica]|uniref:PEGA domain-containing protein n=1 Tax=Sunxiuqinia elliptica TaxID=655355 RepID=A0A1I2FLD1_9BACT|nr:hypothetical protein [Sunxiuqinia elliptica]SFF05316.1 hypothetical protein SAMN05216283_102509 [Sunxiuqinia elliptica]